MTENPSATFIGLRSALDETTLESILPTVDMTGVENGTHQLNVVFSLQNGVTLQEPITVTVVLADKTNTEENTQESIEGGTTTSETESTVEVEGAMNENVITTSTNESQTTTSGQETTAGN